MACYNNQLGFTPDPGCEYCNGTGFVETNPPEACIFCLEYDMFFQIEEQIAYFDDLEVPVDL